MNFYSEKKNLLTLVQKKAKKQPTTKRFIRVRSYGKVCGHTDKKTSAFQVPDNLYCAYVFKCFPGCVALFFTTYCLSLLVKHIELASLCGKKCCINNIIIIIQRFCFIISLAFTVCYLLVLSMT